MARGSGAARTISAGGVPEITYLARAMGDYSSIRNGINQGMKTGFMDKKGPLAQRGKNRLAGRGAGLVFGKAQAWMGLWGLVAVAQGVALVRNLIEIQAAKETWVGSIANYSQAVNSGHHAVPPTWFFTNGMIEASNARYGNKIGKGMFRPPSFVNPKGKTRIRGGLYESQKFMGDFGALYRGQIGSRIVRRETGREVASFFWGTLQDPKKNVLRSYAYDIVRATRRNLVKGKHIDTGALWASLAVSDISRSDFIAKSVKQMADQLHKQGRSRELRTRVDFGPAPQGPF